MKKIPALFAFSVLLLIPVGSQNVFADITIFNDKTTFLISTGAASATGPLPDLGLIAGGAAASQTVGTATFTITPPSSELYIGGAGTGIPGGDWTAINPGADIAISGFENLNVDLAAPVFALGFDFVEPATGFGAGTGFTDTTFSLTLKNGAVMVDSFQFNAPDDVLAFVGVQSDLPFDRVEILDITATNDDEFWGEFYTSSTPPGCTVDPDMVDTGVLAVGASHEVVKGVNCLGGIVDVVPDVSDCASHRINVSFDDPPLIDLIGLWWMDETIVNNNSIPGKTTCSVIFEIDVGEGTEFVTQTIMVTTPGPTVVGGEFLLIDSTALVLAGLQSSAIWMLPILAGAAGAGLAAFKLRKRI